MNNQVLLHLSLIDGIGPVAIKQLLDACQKQAMPDVYRLNTSDVRSFGFTQRIAQALVDGLADTCALDQELAQLERHQIELISLLDEHYPAALRHITAPPPVLYVRGVLPSYDRCLAIVGSRQGTVYAKTFIDQLVPVLAQHHWCVVSGGAVGVDSMAHQAALAHGMPTIAVLGSGLLEPYPASNNALFERIVAQGGALVSPFALRVAPDKGTFPARNRIIAGLSRGVLVVQAAQRSGALISAYHALEQGREVFAVPGPFDDQLSAGCHALLRQGATLVCHAHDVLRECGVIAQPPPVGKQRSVQSPVVVAPLTFEQRVLHACQTPRSIDELCGELDVAYDVLYACILSLQLNGKLRQDFAGLFLRVN